MKFAIYDFDGTLLQTQTVPFILEHWETAKLTPELFKKIKTRIYIRYLLLKLKIFGIKKDEFRYWAMAQVGELFGSISLDQLSTFLDSLFEKSKTKLHKKVVKQIQKDKQDGHTTVLVSGNFDVFLERYRHLGFDHIIGTSLFNQQGKVHQPLNILSADLKVLSLITYFKTILWEKTKAYSDSFADIGLLSKVKEAICVTPDKQLLKHAKANQWRIML
jgi:phosphoserine phosphatase